MPEVLINSFSDRLAAGIDADDASCTVTGGVPAEYVGGSARVVFYDVAGANTEFVRATFDTSTTWTLERAAEDADRFPARAWAAPTTRIDAVITSGGLPATLAGPGLSAGAGALAGSLVGETTPDPTVFCRTLPPGERSFDTSGANSSSRDPRPFYAPNFDGLGNNYIVLYDRVGLPGYGTGVWTLGWAVGASLDSLTDRGVYLNPATLDASRPSAGAATLYKDSAGTYHMLLGTADLWGPPTLARLRRLTSTSLVGATPTTPPTWTDQGVVVADGTNRYVDPSNIVSYRGKYRFVCVEYTGMSGTGRRMVMFEADTLGGSWTMTATPSQTGGPSLATNVDSPGLFIRRGRLFLTTTPAGSEMSLWDISRWQDGGRAQYLGPCCLPPSYEVTAGTQPDWTMTGVVQRPDGLIEGLIQDGTSYEKWIPVRLVGYPRLVAGTFNSFVNLGTKSGSGSQNSAIAWGTTVPECTYRVRLFLQVVESGSYTAGEYAAIDLGSGFANLGKVQPTSGGGVVAGGFAEALLTAPIQQVVVRWSNVGSALINYSINEVWCLPE